MKFFAPITQCTSIIYRCAKYNFVTLLLQTVASWDIYPIHYEFFRRGHWPMIGLFPALGLCNRIARLFPNSGAGFANREQQRLWYAEHWWLSDLTFLSNYERKLIFLYVLFVTEVEVLYFYFHVLEFYLSILVQLCALQLITLVSSTRVYMILNNKWAKIWPQAVTCGHFFKSQVEFGFKRSYHILSTRLVCGYWCTQIYFTELILFTVALFPIVNVTYHFQFLNN